MYPYQKPQMELLLDLVKEANPGITLPFTPATMKTNTPTAQAVPPGGIVDTTVNISPRTNDNYIGGAKVQYRRIKIINFFKNMTPVPVDFYSPLTSVTPAVFAAKINEQYGTSFVPADFSPSYNSYSQNTVMTMGIADSSLCYSPTNVTDRVQFVWRPRKPNINEVTINGALTGRLYPGGNDFVTPGRKPQGEYLAYSVDNTSPTITGRNIGTGTVINTAAWAAVLAPLKEIDPRFSEIVAPTVVGGLNGLSFVTYNLPSVLVPEANTAAYKYAIVIVSQSNSWFQGRLILHYN